MRRFISPTFAAPILTQLSTRYVSSTAVAADVAAEKSPSKPKEQNGLLQILRFDPQSNSQKIDTFSFVKKNEYMVLDLLVAVKAHQDPSLAFRASCCEGVCGSCAMNINGINSLACVTYAQEVTTVGPLPNMPVIKDLVVDMKLFFNQYAYIRPYTRNVNLSRYHIQSIYNRYQSAMSVKNNAFRTALAPTARVLQFTAIPDKRSVYLALLDRLVQNQEVGKVVLVLKKMRDDGCGLGNKREMAILKAI